MPSIKRIASFSTALLLLSASVALLPVRSAALPDGANVTCIVVGKYGSPKAYVRVQFAGPEAKKLSTNKNGEVGTTLKAGSYEVVVQDKNRRQTFKIDVSATPSTHTLTLSW